MVVECSGTGEFLRSFLSEGATTIPARLLTDLVGIELHAALDQMTAHTLGEADETLGQQVLVIAVDVGYGQLEWKLRNDSRVVVREKTNIRNLAPASLPFMPELATIDASFISLKLILPKVRSLLAGNTFRSLVELVAAVDTAPPAVLAEPTVLYGQIAFLG